MNTTRHGSNIILALALAAPAFAQEPEEATAKTFRNAAEEMQTRLEESLEELTALRQRIVDEKLPLSARLRELESELSEVRTEYQAHVRLLDRANLDLSNLKSEIKAREDEAAYLGSLFSEYQRNFESRLHIAELQRYEEAIEKAKLAPENTNLTKREVYETQASLLSVSLDRLFDALGGAQFEGTALDEDGLVTKGSFVLVGPAALFRSADGRAVGTAEQRLGSLEPAAIAYPTPEENAAAAKLVTDRQGQFPLDPTLGNAHKIAATEETFLEHVQKGGPVMYPIGAMAGLALLVALLKLLGLMAVPKPSRRRVDALLGAIAEHDEESMEDEVKRMRGPVGEMLRDGVDHIREPKDLIEEVMWETVMKTKLRVNRFLPFIAICAASAPLLGLLGTVTGIINTFTLITVFGSGDVKTLSGGISEALITTKFGLIVAIPSLLLHAFLYRMAKAIVNRMESTAARFLNQVGRTPFGTRREALPGATEAIGAPDRVLVEAQVREIVRDMLGPLLPTDGVNNKAAAN